MQDVKRGMDNNQEKEFKTRCEHPSCLLFHCRHDVKPCSSPSNIPSSPVLATRCLKDTRPPNRALLQPTALHSQQSDKRSLAAGLYILALHAFNELLGSALPPGRKRSRSLIASRTHGQVGHIRAGQRGPKIQGSTSYPSRPLRLEQPTVLTTTLMAACLPPKQRPPARTTEDPSDQPQARPTRPTYNCHLQLFQVAFCSDPMSGAQYYGNTQCAS